MTSRRTSGFTTARSTTTRSAWANGVVQKGDDLATRRSVVLAQDYCFDRDGLTFA